MRFKKICIIIPAWKHTFLHSTRTTHPKLSDDDRYYASSRFRRILSAVFRFCAALLAFPDTFTFVTLATLCLLFVIAIIPDPFLPVCHRVRVRRPTRSSPIPEEACTVPNENVSRACRMSLKNNGFQ